MTILPYSIKKDLSGGYVVIKQVAVINDLSGLGRCSLTAAIPVLSVMGIQPCPLPTAILSNQTGYSSYFCRDFTECMDAYIHEWKKRKLRFDGIYTGFLGSEKQILIILNFVKDFQTEKTFLLVDPVMGDDGVTYDIYGSNFVSQMKRLIHHADIITPNLTELCLLTDTNYMTLTGKRKTSDYLDSIAQLGRTLFQEKTKAIIVTGILYQSVSDTESRYYNLVIEPNQVTAISSKIYGKSYSGTGDLLASVVCGGMVKGDSVRKSVCKAVRFLETALMETVKEHTSKNDGIHFEPYLHLLL